MQKWRSERLFFRSPPRCAFSPQKLTFYFNTRSRQTPNRLPLLPIVFELESNSSLFLNSNLTFRPPRLPIAIASRYTSEGVYLIKS
jgi:hypothetical protein